MNRLEIQVAAYRCWFITSHALVNKMFKGGLNQQIVSDVFDSTPELKPLLPGDLSQKEQIASATFQILQQRRKELDAMSNFIPQFIPRSDDPALQASKTAQFLETTREQMETSLLTIESLVNGDKTFRETFTITSGIELEDKLPLEGVMDKILKICKESGDKEKKLRFIERFRQILREDLPLDQEGLLRKFEEIIFNLNNIGGMILSPKDRVKLLGALDEELEKDPELKTLHDKLNGNVDQLITIAFSALGASHVMKQLGEDVDPKEFYPKQNP